MRLLSSAKSWLRHLLRRRQADADLDEEIRSTLDLLADQRITEGMPPHEARRAAQMELGGVEQVKEAVREARFGAWFDTLLQDIRFGLRMLRKNPGFTAVAVLTLALGIGANTAMFTIVNAWLLRPLPLKDPQQLVSVWRTRAEAPHQPMYFDLYHDYLVWSAQNRTFQSLSAVFQWDYTLTGAGEPQEIHGAIASWNFFETVDTRPEFGRLFRAEDLYGPSSCVISHSLWKERFHAAPDILGRAIELNRKPYVVLGILPAKFSLRVLDRPFETAVWTVITVNDERYTANSPAPVAVIGRLKSGIKAVQAESDLSTLQVQLDKTSPERLMIRNSGVLVANLQEDNTRTIRDSLWLLLGAVSVLLVIACVNTTSLILGRNAQRSKEFAIRMALGSNHWRLLRQLTVETMTIFVLGGAVGLGVAFGLLRAFVAWSPFGVLPPRGVSLNAPVLAVTASLVCVTALLFGSLPALRTLKMDRQNELGSGSRSTPDQTHLRSRSIFVTIEIALSVVLLVGAGLVISTFVRIDSEPLGFQTRNVFVTDLALPRAEYRSADDRTRFCRELSRRVRSLPGVEAVGCALSWPFNVDGLTSLETDTLQGLPMESLPQAATFEVGPGYFDALGVPLLRGRTFADTDIPESTPVAVISDEMANKYFRGEDPLGRRVKLRYIDQPPSTERWLTIVGVVGSTKSIRYNDQVHWRKYPAVYTSFFQHSAEFPVDLADTAKIYVYVRATSMNADVIAMVVSEIDSNLPIGTLQTTSQIVSDLRSQPRMRAFLIGGFGFWTLFLAAVGVGGVMAQTVKQRRHEIGVRVALGAQRRDIVLLILGQSAQLTFAGIAAGLMLAWAVARLFSAFLYDVSTIDPLTFVTASLILFIVSMGAAWIPGRWAMRVDPMVVLRYE